MIWLNEPVDGLQGIEPYYDNEDDIETGHGAHNRIMTYVGYGASCRRPEIDTINYRKVCRAYRGLCENNTCIVSGRNRMVWDKTKGRWISRDAIDLEVILTGGASGGATLDSENRLIGLSSHIHKPHFLNGIIFRSVPWINNYIHLLREFYPIPFVPFPYDCQKSGFVYSTSLKKNKDWIESNRQNPLNFGVNDVTESVVAVPVVNDRSYENTKKAIFILSMSIHAFFILTYIYDLLT